MTQVLSQLKDAQETALNCGTYGKRLTNKLEEAEAFASVWQKHSKELKTKLDGLKPLMDNKILSNQLSTLLSITEGILHCGDQTGIAFKKIHNSTQQGEFLIQQIKDALDEIIVPLMLFVKQEQPEEELSSDPKTPAVLLFSSPSKQALDALTALRQELDTLAGSPVPVQNKG